MGVAFNAFQVTGELELWNGKERCRTWGEPIVGNNTVESYGNCGPNMKCT